MPHHIDVRLPEAFERATIPGAVNNPVFQMGFLDRIPSEWSKDDPVELIGESDASQEATMALEKLQRAGYQNVSVLAEGLSGWIADGQDTVGSHDPVAVTPTLHGTLPVDLGSSELQWIGRNLINRHYGTLQFSEASLTFEQGVLAGGTFVINWDSLACTDLDGTELHGVLMAHLKDHDFFDVGAYDAPSVSITSVTPVDDATPGSPNLSIEADLTLKGVTKPISFDATGGPTEGGYAF